MIGVLVEPSRSASPPTSDGTSAAAFCRIVPARLRVASVLRRRRGGELLRADPPARVFAHRAIDLGLLGVLGEPLLLVLVPLRVDLLPAPPCARRTARAPRPARRTACRAASRAAFFVASISSSPSGSPCDLVRVVLVRRAVADVRARDDQERPLASPPSPRRAPCVICAWIVAVDVLHAPAVRLEALADVLVRSESSSLPSIVILLSS